MPAERRHMPAACVTNKSASRVKGTSHASRARARCPPFRRGSRAISRTKCRHTLRNRSPPARLSQPSRHESEARRKRGKKSGTTNDASVAVRAPPSRWTRHAVPHYEHERRTVNERVDLDLTIWIGAKRLFEYFVRSILIGSGINRLKIQTPCPIECNRRWNPTQTKKELHLVFPLKSH